MQRRHERPPYAPFSISTVRSGDRAVVAAVGELDLASVRQFEREVTDALAAGATRIVLDLGRVDFIDSTGLRVLLALRNDFRRRRHALAVVPPGPAAQRIFEITGTRGLFDWQSEPSER